MTGYKSTRGGIDGRDFESVLLAGLAEDGGLFVPAAWPRFSAADLRRMRAMTYPELAAEVLAPFTEGCFTRADLLEMASAVYGRFDHPAVAPLKQLDTDLWLLELFHGPTLAFKDFAMQLLAEMFDRVLTRRGETITIVGATSGDTGAAAVQAFAGKSQVRVAMLHPEGRISPVQRRQMTTILADNVLNIALAGTFDDCQDLVKAMFADQPFRTRINMSAVNSINWARIAAQSVYYFWAALRLGAPDRPSAFCVPTGNFGNVYAGWAARQMGLPIEQLTVATNANDILARFFEGGVYAKDGVVPTMSPSMDIQVASNFERLLLDLEGNDAGGVRRRMASFAQSGEFEVDHGSLERVSTFMKGGSASERATAAMIANTHERTGELVDPHTAVALHVAELHMPPKGVPMISLSTAHPAKFPDAVATASGIHPALPPRYAHLMDLPESTVTAGNDLREVETLITERFSIS
ncbi:threonine synthase [Arboricoccus pini]|uniref:Threonine synthase n=1 Tax=Arboricoccus pini TaxID=1963835 RepID=A0A212QZA8_9PROT|nr:threonine synthase [Arboricoccus pini]SNB65082.1 threonine synthase [Arboricoccus pini]